MIDYEKLKLCHWLAEKISEEQESSTTISCNFYYAGHDFDVIQNGVSMGFIDINIMLKYLQQIAQPQPKYKDSWYIKGGLIKSTKVENKPYFVVCDETDPEAIGLKAYGTKTEAIQSQIDYWTKLKQEPQEQCQELWKHCLKCKNEWRYDGEYGDLLLGSCLLRIEGHNIEEGRLPQEPQEQCQHSQIVWDGYVQSYSCMDCKVPIKGHPGIESCQHEPDMDPEWHSTINGCFMKCTKCGEYYK